MTVYPRKPGVHVRELSQATVTLFHLFMLLLIFFSLFPSADSSCTPSAQDTHTTSSLYIPGCEEVSELLENQHQ